MTSFTGSISACRPACYSVVASAWPFALAAIVLYLGGRCSPSSSTTPAYGCASVSRDGRVCKTILHATPSREENHDLEHTLHKLARKNEKSHQNKVYVERFPPTLTPQSSTLTVVAMKMKMQLVAEAALNTFFWCWNEDSSGNPFTLITPTSILPRPLTSMFLSDSVSTRKGVGVGVRHTKSQS